jgi:DegT/DnrJ/EryC1/StrS aminotransferase family
MSEGCAACPNVCLSGPIGDSLPYTRHDSKASRPVKRMPVAGPSITQKEIDYVTEAVSTAWYERANRFHERFETAFAMHCGPRHAVSLRSCMAGCISPQSPSAFGPATRWWRPMRPGWRSV